MVRISLNSVVDEINILPNVEEISVEEPPSHAPDNSIRLEPVFIVKCFKKPEDESLKESIRKVFKKHGISAFHLHLEFNTLLDKNGDIWTVPYC